MRLPFSSADRLVGAGDGDDELVEHVIDVARIGADDLQQAGRGELAHRERGRGGAVGAAVDASGDHALDDLRRPGELDAFHVEAGVLEEALLERG